MRSSLLSILLGAALFALSTALFSAEETAEEEVKKPLQYYELTPSVVANVQKGAKYLRADIQLMTREESGLNELDLHAPALRHELFLLISDQDGRKLKAARGKEKFRKDALKSLQDVMKEHTGNEVIEELFFTSFFVQ